MKVSLIIPIALLLALGAGAASQAAPVSSKRRARPAAARIVDVQPADRHQQHLDGRAEHRFVLLRHREQRIGPRVPQGHGQDSGVCGRTLDRRAGRQRSPCVGGRVQQRLQSRPGPGRRAGGSGTAGEQGLQAQSRLSPRERGDRCGGARRGPGGLHLRCGAARSAAGGGPAGQHAGDHRRPDAVGGLQRLQEGLAAQPGEQCGATRHRDPADDVPVQPAGPTTGAFVGRVGAWRPEGWVGFELGWALSRQHWGKNYAYESARAAGDWIFDAFSLEHLVSLIHVDNLRSQRLAQRLGMSAVTETMHAGMPHAIWAIAREDWVRTRRAAA